MIKSLRAPVIVATGLRVFSIASFILSALSIIGPSIVSKTSLPTLSAKSITPRNALLNIPIILAVTCCAVSPPNTLNISAKAAEKSPTKSAISPDTLNIPISLSLINCWFCSKY